MSFSSQSWTFSGQGSPPTSLGLATPQSASPRLSATSSTLQDPSKHGEGMPNREDAATSEVERTSTQAPIGRWWSVKGCAFAALHACDPCSRRKIETLLQDLSRQGYDAPTLSSLSRELRRWKTMQFRDVWDDTLLGPSSVVHVPLARAHFGALLCTQHAPRNRAQLATFLRHVEQRCCQARQRRVCLDGRTMQALARLAPQERDAQLLQLCGRLANLQTPLDVADLLRSLCRVKRGQRPLFVDMVERLLTPKLAVETSRRLISLLARSGSQWPRRLAPALRLARHHWPDAGPLLVTMGDWPIGACEAITKFCAPILDLLLVEDIPKTRAVLFKVPIANRKAFTKQVHKMNDDGVEAALLAEAIRWLGTHDISRGHQAVDEALKALMHDSENVMRAHRQARAKRAFDQLDAICPKELAHDVLLTQMGHHVLEELTKLWDVVGSRRGEDAELDATRTHIALYVRARDALWGGKRDRHDFSDGLIDNTQGHTAKLAAMVAYQIAAYHPPELTPEMRAQAQENMRFALVRALGECIADDGHRVCKDGYEQRFVGILQGYVPGIYLDAPTPKALLRELGSDMRSDAARGIRVTEQTFVDTSLKRARALFPPASQDLRVFEEELRAYLAEPYGEFA